LQFGYTKSRQWIRFEIPPSSLSAQTQFYLNIPFIYFEKVAFYTTENGKVISRQLQGMGVAHQDDPSHIPATGAFVFPLAKDPVPQNAIYYLSVEGDFPLSVPMQIESADELRSEQVSRNLFIGFFFGALAFAFILNAFLAVMIRSQIFLFYGLFVANVLMLFMGHERVSSQFLWPQSPHWALLEMHIFGGATFLFYILFVRSFLETRRWAVRLDRTLLALAAISLLRTFWLIFESNQTVAMIGQTAIVLGNFLVLVVAVRGLLKRVRAARYFLISSFVFNAGYILFVLQTVHVYYFGHLIEYAPHIGVLTEVLLLGLALGDRIQQTNQQLQQRKMEIMNYEKMAALGRMAASISHEINNPLTIIGANAGSIESWTHLPSVPLEKIQSSSQAIERNVLRISKIIKSMRTVARDATNDPMIDYRLSEIINDVLTLCQDRFHNEDVSLKVSSIDPDIWVTCRSPEICQVLINLINNAVDAIQDQEKKEITIDCNADDHEVLISVTDNGPGVPVEIRDQIYEPFFTSKPVGKGTGLGLSISRTLIENHGGKLWLDTNSAKTRFVFSLPRAASVK
jgi:signal transduction histidine kinase